MKRILLGVAVLAAAPLFAQQTPAPAKPAAADVVATVNGETITRAKLDLLWNRLSARARQQYEKTGGGKAGFLDNYVRKRLLLQKAMQSGFDKKPEVQAELEAAKESALFDLYVRDVVGSQVVSENEVRKFYDANPSNFAYGERRYLRDLFVSTKNHSVEEARAKLGPIFADLHAAFMKSKAAGETAEEFGRTFGEFARQYSEDSTAAVGGVIGWFEQSQLDPKLADGVFAMVPGTMSGILETDQGLQVIYVEKTRAPEKETYEQARAGIREYLLGNNMSRIMESVNQTTTALRESGKVTLYPENIH
ncbi:MAG TPA: peptidyl-prolyl cis-trans isomerase [Thermoanaerobaculia bacterium]|nr:peptidyl-prolyl cis-trans isomerase [Thermoanaerobaculia bacterium]